MNHKEIKERHERKERRLSKNKFAEGFKTLGLSATELAEMMGVSVRTVQYWQRGTVMSGTSQRLFETLILLKNCEPKIFSNLQAVFHEEDDVWGDLTTAIKK